MNVEVQIERITDAVRDQRTLVPTLFPREAERGIDHRIACLELTRAIDHALWLADVSKAPADLGRAALLFRGFNSALSYFLDSDTELSGIPIAPSHEASAQWADNTLTRLALMEQAERIAGLARAGLVSCVEATPKRVVFETPAGFGLREQRDVASGRWMAGMAVEQDQAEYEDIVERWPEVRALLQKNVRLYAEDYLAYDSDPALDDYYERIAILHARRSIGHDAFDPWAEFGGLPFGAYGATTTRLVGFAYKHMHFAREAAQMFASTNPRNLVTTWTSLENKAGFVAAALDCDERDAKKLVQLSAATPRVISTLAKIVDGPAPFFIPVCREYWASSIAATIVAPYDLLLRRLKEEYPHDWFRHVDAREQAFRGQLRWLFPVRRVHYADKPVKLRQASREVTDIDAVVFVKATGTLGLFQLKWQDRFGADLRERRSRMTNLMPSANRWVDKVTRWLEANSANQLLLASGFPREVLGTVKNVRLFVLGRYHVGFSDGEPQDARAAWSTWPELIRLIDEAGSVEDPVLRLFDDMRLAQQAAMKVKGIRVRRIPMPGFDIEVREQVTAVEDLGTIPEQLVP